MKIDPQGWERITVFAFTFKNKIANMVDNAARAATRTTEPARRFARLAPRRLAHTAPRKSPRLLARPDRSSGERIPHEPGIQGKTHEQECADVRL
jgi:hypothetical protein